MRTAVATFGFGRPDHFERMLTSLGTCPEVVDGVVDVVHFLDGGPGAEQDALRAVIQGAAYRSRTSLPGRPTLALGGSLSVPGGNCWTSEVTTEWSLSRTTLN